MALIDQDGNKITDGDWIACSLAGLVRGNVAMVSDGGIALPNGQVSPAFINVIIQIPTGQNGRLPVSKIFGPYQAVPEVTGG